VKERAHLSDRPTVMTVLTSDRVTGRHCWTEHCIEMKSDALSMVLHTRPAAISAMKHKPQQQIKPWGDVDLNFDPFSHSLDTRVTN